MSVDSTEISRALTAADAALAGGAVAAGDRPSRGEITRVLAELRAALFPRELGVAADGEAAVATHLASALGGLREQIRRCAVLFAAERPGEGLAPDQVDRVTSAFAAELPAIRTLKTSPSPRSKTISTGVRESMQLKITAIGNCPSAVALL